MEGKERPKIDVYTNDAKNRRSSLCSSISHTDLLESGYQESGFDKI